MEAKIHFNFVDIDFNESTKEITVDTSAVMETIQKEFRKFIEETHGCIYGCREDNNTTIFEGNVDITIYIIVDDKQYSVHEFTNSYKV